MNCVCEQFYKVQIDGLSQLVSSLQSQLSKLRSLMKSVNCCENNSEALRDKNVNLKNKKSNIGKDTKKKTKNIISISSEQSFVSHEAGTSTVISDSSSTIPSNVNKIQSPIDKFVTVRKKGKHIVIYFSSIQDVPVGSIDFRVHDNE